MRNDYNDYDDDNQIVNNLTPAGGSTNPAVAQPRGLAAVIVSFLMGVATPLGWAVGIWLAVMLLHHLEVDLTFLWDGP